MSRQRERLYSVEQLCLHIIMYKENDYMWGKYDAVGLWEDVVK